MDMPRFEWRGFPIGYDGHSLVTGRHYEVSDFGRELVKAWVESGLAIYIESAESMPKHITLSVHSPIVDFKSPRIGDNIGGNNNGRCN